MYSTHGTHLSTADVSHTVNIQLPAYHSYLFVEGLLVENRETEVAVIVEPRRVAIHACVYECV